MDLPDDVDSPYFPQELEQLIFTLGAQTSVGKDLASLRLVCRRARSWVEPFRFRVLSLTLFGTKLARQEYRALLLSLPAEVMSSSVQRVWMGSFGQQDFEILSKCRRITDLAFVTLRPDLLDLTVFASLRRLVLTDVVADELFDRMRPHSQHNFHPSLNSLTHLQVFGSSEYGIWILKFNRVLPHFPALAHFMLEYAIRIDTSSWDPLCSIASLTQMIMTVILKCPPHSTWGQEPLYPLFIRHPKVVALDWEREMMRQEWDTSCLGRADAWDTAEQIMKKREKEN